MIPALLLSASIVSSASPAAPADEPLDRYVFALRQGDQFMSFAFQLDTTKGRLEKREAELLKGWKPSEDGSDPLDQLCPHGRLLRVERFEASPHSEPLTDAILNALDANQDGKLSREELKDAAKVLLKKFDADGDECLTPLEIVPNLLTVAGARKRPPFTLAIAQPGDPAPRPVPKKVPQPAFALNLDKPWRVVATQGRWRVDVVVAPLVKKPEVPKTLLREGREKDRDRFTAVAAEVYTASIRPQARGFFELLDADGDGQLSVRELRRAWESLADDPAKDEFVALPGEKVYAMSLTLAPGTATRAPVRLTKAPAPERGPKWFRALDRNGDGDVSRKEFNGTDEQFKHYDADGDGLIPATEAEAGDAKLKQGDNP